MKRTLAQTGYRIEPLASGHDRAGFSCGVEELDTYLQRRARQDSDRNLASVFILTPDSRTVAGFYTLSALSVLAAHMPEPHRKKLPSFPLPATLLGRMAVSQHLRGLGLGEFLLLDALQTALIASRRVASMAVLVDAKIGARDFYLKHNFVPFPLQPERLYLTMTDIARIFG